MNAADEPSLTHPPAGAVPIRSTARLALVSAGLAWMFDALDPTIFTLILFPTVSTLIGSTDAGRVAATAGLILTYKIFACGIRGLAFGVVADRIGRATTMAATLVIYSIFTGLSGLARTWWQIRGASGAG